MQRSDVWGEDFAVRLHRHHPVEIDESPVIPDVLTLDERHRLARASQRAMRRTLRFLHPMLVRSLWRRG